MILEMLHNFNTRTHLLRTLKIRPSFAATQHTSLPGCAVDIIYSWFLSAEITV